MLVTSLLFYTLIPLHETKQDEFMQLCKVALGMFEQETGAAHKLANHVHDGSPAELIKAVYQRSGTSAMPAFVSSHDGIRLLPERNV